MAPGHVRSHRLEQVIHSRHHTDTGNVYSGSSAYTPANLMPRYTSINKCVANNAASQFGQQNDETTAVNSVKRPHTRALPLCGNTDSKTSKTDETTRMTAALCLCRILAAQV